MINKDFYPTPSSLISKMWSKVDKNRVKTILEPSAGKGDILDYIQKSYRVYGYKYSAIELDTELRATLTGKKYRVIDSDFLAYSGLDKFDLIIGNPPFSSGDLHLLKAINSMFSGQIVFLLNAETLKNPYTNTRKLLVQKLEELNAEIEYIPNAFIGAERTTKVEIALIYISITRDIETELFEGCTDKVKEKTLDDDFETSDIAHRNTVEFMVEEFNASVTKGTQLILDFYRNKRLIGGVLTLGVPNDDRYPSAGPDINTLFNDFLSAVRRDYWKNVLNIPEVKKRMTTKEVSAFHEKIAIQSNMDFTERNVRTFIVDLIGKYDEILNRAVTDLFNTFTQGYSWHEECKKNIHYFNGWKTNKSFYVNKKVIIPWTQWTGYSGGVRGYGTDVNYSLRRALDDVDMVMNYFTLDPDFISIADAVNNSLKDPAREGSLNKIESTHFVVTFYLKGTMHLTFRNPDTLRRFNIVACKEKNWLPEDYGRKKYTDMDTAEKSVVEAFEGKESYVKNIGMIGYTKQTLMIEDMAV